MGYLQKKVEAKSTQEEQLRLQQIRKEQEARLQQLQKEEEERLKKAKEEFLDYLKKQADENNVITFALCDQKGNREKQIAMNYLLFERDFVCVQNDVSSEKSTTVFTLTFVKRGNLSRFSIGNI